ncbi:MAG: hypothetical protein WC975_04750 [Phycisphaerae bacterium]
MPTTRSVTRVALEARRRVIRRERSSPDDQIRRRLIIRPNGEQHWQPGFGTFPPPAELPVPAEVWIRFSEPRAQNYPEPINGPIQWDFVRWLDASRTQWADRKIDIYFLSFDLVSIKTDLFERLRAIRDRNLRWQTNLLTDGKNIASTAMLDQLLRSTLDEVQIYVAGLGESAINVKVLGAVKDLVDLRSARRQNHPKIICRLCSHLTGGTKSISEISQWAKQVGIDRLEVVDNQTEEKRLWAL